VIDSVPRSNWLPGIVAKHFAILSRAVVLKLFVAAGPLHPKPLWTLRFVNVFFDYWEIRFGRFLAWQMCTVLFQCIESPQSTYLTFNYKHSYLLVQKQHFLPIVTSFISKRCHLLSRQPGFVMSDPLMQPKSTRVMNKSRSSRLCFGDTI